ncbi:recombinase RecA [Candidatus Azambacteria bacterium]|nr:recombinase RecA [Candidatus Azambacteria bacterium]
MSKEDTNKILENAVQEIKDKFGEGSIMRLDEVRKVDLDVIPTGSLSLDLALGVFGIPRGRIVEIYGPEGSGKTSLSLHISAEAQKKGGKVAFIDAEHALDPEYAKKIGVKMKDFLISQPDNGEQALDIVESLVRSGAVDIIIVDSVAALTPRAEIEGEMGDQQMGLQARLMSRALRKLTAISSKSNTIIIFINQIRMQIGVFFGNPETTTGGKALKFYSSVRIEVRKAAQLKKGEVIIGNKVKVKVVKNKVAPPFRTAEFDIMFNEGISYEADVITTGLIYGIIKKTGNTLSFGEQKLGVGLENSRQFLKANQPLVKKIADAIKKKSLDKTTEVEPVTTQ